MAKSVYLLVRKQGTIASQNRHLGRSLYTLQYPYAANENIEAAISNFSFKVSYIPPIDLSLGVSTRMLKGDSKLNGSVYNTIYVDKTLPHSVQRSKLIKGDSKLVSSSYTSIYGNVDIPPLMFKSKTTKSDSALIGSSFKTTVVTASNTDSIMLTITNFKGDL